MHELKFNIKLSLYVFVCLLGMVISSNAKESRIALVIGVSDYSFISKLANTVNDTRLISSKLRELDFEVFAIENPGIGQLRAAVKDFAFEAETADVALVYYAGHGVEFGGINYLIPADINAENRSEITSGSVSLDDLLISVDKARQLRIVILDSCRNDPFADLGIGGSTITVTDASTRRAGLAPPAPDRGTLVAFAAEAGSVALDGSGNNSPFAMALSEHLGTANLEIGLVFRRIRDSVLRSTANGQEPHTYGSLPGNPYFLAGNSQSANQLNSAERRNAWGGVGPDEEVLMSKLATTGDTRSMLGLAYMRLNPNDSKFAPEQAIIYLEKAANAGDPEAQYELGRQYEKGIGVKQDTRRALELYQLAAKADYADAINDLGFLHFQGGLGIVRDQKLAISYFERAADLRHPQAMFNFAALIDDGIVPGKTPKHAAIYLFNALRSGVSVVLQQLSENPLMFKKPTRKELQRQLANVSYYDGAIDGAFGPGTKRSMERAFGIKE